MNYFRKQYTDTKVTLPQIHEHILVNSYVLVNGRQGPPIHFYGTYLGGQSKIVLLDNQDTIDLRLRHRCYTLRDLEYEWSYTTYLKFRKLSNDPDRLVKIFYRPLMIDTWKPQTPQQALELLMLHNIIPSKHINWLVHFGVPDAGAVSSVKQA